MLFKRLSLAVLAAASSQLALASPTSSVLQFAGAVKGTTCTISVGGVEAPNPATVTLGPVNLEELRKNILWVDGVEFDIDLKNCAGAATQASAIFQGVNGTTVTNGRLDNMATSDPAKHVQLAVFMRAAVGPLWIAANIGSTTPASYHWIDIEEEKLRLRASYAAENSNREKVTAGNFEAAMQFTVLYQ